MAVSNKSKIIIDVSLDENKVPEKLHWSAKDGGVENQQAKAMLLSVWDAKAKESMRIDLWTKDMPLDEMKIFFHQTIQPQRCWPYLRRVATAGAQAPAAPP
jgi:gliding motility-associated protein GldC